MTTDQPTKQGIDLDQLNAIYNMGVGSRFSEDGVVRDHRTQRILGGDKADGSDVALNVSFSLEPVFSKLATWQNGGLPTYADMEFVTVSAPGQRETLIHTQATDYYQWRFPAEYKAFKDGQQAAVTGTPLSIWPYLKPSDVKALEHQGVRTVEQLASLSDSVKGMQSLKARAKEFLAAAKDTAKAGVLQDELAQRDAQLAAMQQQLDDLKAAIAAQPAKQAKAPAKDA